MSSEVMVQVQGPLLNDGQRALLKRTLGDQRLTDDEFAMFLGQCERTRLDPFTRQIYCFKSGGRVSISATIDGFRAIASRSGEYEGQVGPEWCGADGEWRDVWLGTGHPHASRVGVWRKGFQGPCWGVATWTSYGSNRGTWAKMPDLMLAKCAESLALRKAFPAELSGLYERAELDASAPAQDAGPREVAPAALVEELSKPSRPGGVQELIENGTLTPGDEDTDGPGEALPPGEAATDNPRPVELPGEAMPAHGTAEDKRTILDALLERVDLVLVADGDAPSTPFDKPRPAVWFDMFGTDRWKGPRGVMSLPTHVLRDAIKVGNDGYTRAERVAMLVKAGIRRPGEGDEPLYWPSPEAWAKFGEVS